ncbi:DUF4179 domain-containing protein [Bacillus sp. FJAT-29790]|uniref:DUF4179 domain-containing protein n=1 Tax=Bacillus sp. FJAT-29790 TaxID=1895002 RepID=UPI001C219A4A|nr:DUF4179 domain-containing protein [Bacillus sp. FJAT-29790]MBU8881249.1 DUF4179 domain-containing protein [Bacillus sp. FJAT-29790]
MKESKLDRELNAFIKEHRNSEVPAAFSKGIDQTLADLSAFGNKPLQKKKKNWLYAVAATGFLGAGILGSGFASPAMAEMLTKVPGLNFIYSAVYKDVSKEREDPHLLRGALFGYGEKGAFNTAGGDIEVKMFSDYTEEVENYIGMKIPHLDRNADHLTIRVDKYGENQFEILEMGYLNGEDVILNIVPYAINSPQFEGESVSPVIKSAVDINGVKADVLSYQFSETDKENRTNYITWKRNKFTFVLAGTASINKLTSIAKVLDEQAIILEKNE